MSPTAKMPAIGKPPRVPAEKDGGRKGATKKPGSSPETDRAFRELHDGPGLAAIADSIRTGEPEMDPAVRLAMTRPTLTPAQKAARLKDLREGRKGVDWKALGYDPRAKTSDAALDARASQVLDDTNDLKGPARFAIDEKDGPREATFAPGRDSTRETDREKERREDYLASLSPFERAMQSPTSGLVRPRRRGGLREDDEHEEFMDMEGRLFSLKGAPKRVVAEAAPLISQGQRAQKGYAAERAGQPGGMFGAEDKGDRGTSWLHPDDFAANARSSFDWTGRAVSPTTNPAVSPAELARIEEDRERQKDPSRGQPGDTSRTQPYSTFELAPGSAEARTKDPTKPRYSPKEGSAFREFDEKAEAEYEKSLATAADERRKYGW